eukprot:CAMPEP_0202847406 /NCGR_PEP_ID=MMETSP1389-20130828/75330_1 /ASSEMBLY_ACC=CAM_ASM_000865 /TAXON_ID=302021 /ORGANISM="Rhodomonas sp., Strain CCMP768" /LENGTH=31 /DNA_ID= /DNA_START= /DNA_END= /DNA_ORIENTATION=
MTPEHPDCSIHRFPSWYVYTSPLPSTGTLTL